jgi:hypothetical protein
MANKKQRAKRDNVNLVAAKEDWQGMDAKRKRNARREKRNLKRVLEA